MKPYYHCKGDVFQPIVRPGAVITCLPHVCNNRGGWGAGFTGELTRRYPATEKYYRGLNTLGRWLELGSTFFQILDPPDNQVTLVCAHMVAQNGYASILNPDNGGQPFINYTALFACMTEVGDQCLHNHAAIRCPRFATGLAGGTWEHVEQLILSCWVQRGIEVHVYEYEPDPTKWSYREVTPVFAA